MESSPNKDEVTEDDDTTTVSSNDVTVIAVQLTVPPMLVRLLQLLVMSVLALGFCLLATAL